MYISSPEQTFASEVSLLASLVLPGRNYQFSVFGRCILQVLGRTGTSHQGRESFPCSSSQGFYLLASDAFLGSCSFHLFGRLLMKNGMEQLGRKLKGPVIPSAISSHHLIPSHLIRSHLISSHAKPCHAIPSHLISRT